MDESGRYQHLPLYLQSNSQSNPQSKHRSLNVLLTLTTYKVTPKVTLKENYEVKEKYDLILSKATGYSSVYQDGTTPSIKLNGESTLATGVKHEKLTDYISLKERQATVSKTITLNSDKQDITVE